MSVPLSKEAPRATNSKERIWTKDFFLICISNFFIFLSFQMTLPTIPLYVETLGGSDRLIGFIVGIFAFSALLIRPYAGHALDSKGRGFIYILGLSIFTVTIGMFGLIPSLVFLFILRIFQGIGFGFSTTASGTIATDIIPASRRGEGMGFYGLFGNLSLALGPTLGLTLAGHISFTQLFLICAGLGLISLLLSLKINYRKAEKITSPIKKWDLYEKSALPPSILIFFITITFGGVASFLPIYALEKGIQGIQWYFLLYALALMVTRTFAGRIYDQKGHRAVFPFGTGLILIAMFLLAWLPNSFILYLAAVLYGFGFGSIQPALQAWAVQSAEVNRRGMANATFFSSFDLGVGIGAITFGQIAYLFNYSSIYIASALSVTISLVLYFTKFGKIQVQSVNG
ncbi:predicted MFS family arabinose efflux permease [Bacillus oleivorans]|uniref:Predicted MFS family arabinose efflux permease n=1 Tax=Bacillus oleivorans TaxID=1448271 RepID=A0A285CNV4_9BACI|nr:MFS transporter [Bacillus oleivorans]SNX68663.1 predicted MFS family arabinose efflux permease [Bacillus oleivorans]